MRNKKSDKVSKNTIKLTVSGIMVAMSTVLSFIRFSELPYGGSVTLFSFVPILFVGYAYGAKWGISAGIVYGIMQTIFGISGAVSGAGFAWYQVILCALLDYIVAGAMLGTGGAFKKLIKNPQFSFGIGAFFACLLKYISHFLSGYILFGTYAQWFFEEGGGMSYGAGILSSYSGNMLSIIYSLVYNATFMLPETVITVIMACIIISVKPLRKACEAE
ncbi:MAG: energy-coupled thiamine transporter ThiT [Clostridia bacterium]|nr:energy-coupled thiamine transporter ThiT [Clostridia bacterium]